MAESDQKFTEIELLSVELEILEKQRVILQNRLDSKRPLSSELRFLVSGVVAGLELKKQDLEERLNDLRSGLDM